MAREMDRRTAGLNAALKGIHPCSSRSFCICRRCLCAFGRLLPTESCHKEVLDVGAQWSNLWVVCGSEFWLSRSEQRLEDMKDNCSWTLSCRHLRRILQW